MSGVPWTKFQDFYLRYGFLKVAVAALDSDRRSIGSPVLIRRLSQPLLPARRRAAPMAHLRSREGGEKEAKGSPVVEELLRAGDCPSWLYAITEPTTYKIVDWARDAGFLGRGNQIAERGLLLRRYQDETATEAFLAGEVAAWNPFVMTEAERWFLLYHLLEIDPVTEVMIDAIAATEPGQVLETVDAARLFCRAFVDVLTKAEASIQLRDIPEYRTARALASTIAEELDLQEELRGAASWLTDSALQHARGPRPRAPASGARKSHKNADHQTIPRFEQLVDLGMLTKPGADDEANKESARKRWRYEATPLCRAWAAARRDTMADSFAWERFGGTLVQARDTQRTSRSPRATSPTDAVRAAARHLELAFEKVGRPVGMTPFDSLGLRSMLDAALQGEVVEMGFANRMLLAIKRSGVAEGTVFFASGNRVDQMFVQLRSGFAEGVTANAEIIAQEMEAA
ncbi:MAG: hypothetical protein E7812_02215 [Phenylobacterium sp.]|nr:MAG: hypothetical protein E7812_02215 [Phenylobacterium sp.]